MCQPEYLIKFILYFMDYVFDRKVEYLLSLVQLLNPCYISHNYN